MKIDQDGRIVETAIEARAGFLDKPVLLVLVASSLLAIGFLILSYIGVFKL